MEVSLVNGIILAKNLNTLSLFECICIKKQVVSVVGEYDFFLVNALFYVLQLSVQFGLVIESTIAHFCIFSDQYWYWR